MTTAAAEMHNNYVISLLHAETVAKIDKPTLLIDARNAYFIAFTQLKKPAYQQ